ncbi:MAG: hypothetical protein ACKO6B_14950 [Planctomycetia bacterium]
MSAWFPIDEAAAIHQAAVSHAADPLHAAEGIHAAEPSDEVVAIDLSDWSEQDLDLFLALDAQLEEEEAARAQAGVLGRWPFWEIRQWAVARPDQAEQALWVGVFVAGTVLGLLWPILKPCLVWMVQAVWLTCRFLVAIVSALRGANPVEF